MRKPTLGWNHPRIVYREEAKAPTCEKGERPNDGADGIRTSSQQAGPRLINRHVLDRIRGRLREVNDL
ncbi:MAG: hypothetical protein ACR2OZ_03545 [Verrucomicrobiales bacterium]